MVEVNAGKWFDSVATDQQPIADRLRQLVFATVPCAVEEIKWSRPCYKVGGKLFCYLQTAKSHVTLGFQNGTSLDDPYGLLEGTGKDMRHTKIRSSAEINEVALLEQAAR
ncbi:hypothetical protein Poly51_32630 [Rubripirellula tenax]|uniref:YdhG-like domain-containing protein n=1 Tax=Rubripirellula tenax TaxID=2528015 RepID=A0A5C6F1S2_9BACT|nr:DUF1801 domain-containing protein [Rubripirellula tenax]TWU54544.1 hypothetical protein Poly51_32630 [Rubripirellula tenax]